MNLIEALRQVLEQAQSGANTVAPPVAELVAAVTALLESAWEGWKSEGVEDADERFRNAELEWTNPQLLNSGGRSLAGAINERWPDLDVATRARYVKYGLLLEVAVSSGFLAGPEILGEVSIPRVRQLALQRISSEVFGLAGDEPLGAIDQGKYAEALGFTADGRITASGRTFLRLRGPDLCRWVMANEVVRATGPSDLTLAGRTTAGRVLRQGTLFEFGETTGPDDAIHVERFRALGFIEQADHSAESSWPYDLTDLGELILEDLKADPPPPMYALAAALAADATADAIRSVGPIAAAAAADTVEQATVRQVRLIAHELRNKLAPLQTAVGVLGEPRADGDPAREKARSLAESTLTNLFGFVDAMVDLARGLRDPDDWFDLASILSEAVAAGRNGDPNVVIEVSTAHVAHLRVLGPRPRFLLALTNLIRNARQHADGPCRVGIAGVVGPRGLTLSIEDNGRGVARAVRQRIFEPGFSTRPGGTGTGLSLARDVLVEEMGGTLECLDAPRGGARFQIEIPTRRIAAPTKEQI